MDGLSYGFSTDQDGFLKNVTGVVHVGANTGQERGKYDELGLDVIWIEPIPELFARLQENVRSLPRQRAFECLVTDKDGENLTLYVSNNDGLSSSIFDLKEHRDIWPEITYTGAIQVTSTTLTSLFRKASIDPGQYQALVMDTQGSELLVLRGAIPLLGAFRYIKTEVADFEIYAGCCQLSDIEAFMQQHGFSELSRIKFADRPQGGACYDVIYEGPAVQRAV